MSKLLAFTRPVHGVDVKQRRSDGYIDATAMSKAYLAGTGQRREVSEWLSNERTQQSLRHVSLKTGIPVFKLVDAKPGRYGRTWIHPKLSVRFAIWLSDEFGYLVEEWVQEWLLTSRNPIQSNSDEEWEQNQRRYDIRIELKDVLRPELMNATIRWIEEHGGNPRKICAAVHDAMNERIQGAKSREISALGGLPLAALIRDYFGAAPLVTYSAINKLATNAILDRGVEPVQAVHEACDAYLGKAYVPELVPISENLYLQRRRLKAAQKRKALAESNQLSLFDQVS